MKTFFTLIGFFLLVSSSAFGKIVLTKKKLFVENKGNRTPVTLVNELMAKKKISKLKLYGDGKAHVISFAKKGHKEMLYSVDERGFIYSLKPFTEYNVSKVDESSGLIQFKEVPNRKYRVDHNGFFLY